MPGKFFRPLLASWLLASIATVIVAQAATASSQSRFVFASPTAYDNLDPHLSTDAPRSASRINLYDGLLRWVDSPAKLEPWLAESFTVSPDGRVYTFALRKGARFHDGTEVKAADVVYSMERLLALKQGAFLLFQPLVSPGSTKATTDHTVEFSLIKPSATFLSLMPELHVVNKELTKKNEVNNDWGKAWLAKNDAGSGSYRLAKFDPATGFVATRFEAHWNSKWGAKPITEIAFQTTTATEPRITGLIAGDIHATSAVMTQDELKRLRDSPGISIVEAESMRTMQAFVHNAREPLSDVNFRKALSHAFDTDGFIKSGSFAPAARNPLPMPASIWGAPRVSRGYAFDLDKAKEFLARLKEPAREITIAAVAGDIASEQAAATLEKGLARLGVNTKLLIEPMATVATRMRDDKQMYDVLFSSRSVQQPDPASWIGEVFECDQIGKKNFYWYCNRDVDKLLKDAASSGDFEVRRRNYERANSLIVEDAVGIFVATARWQIAISKRVTGMRYNPVTEAFDMRWASMD